MKYTGRYKEEVPARSIKLSETLPKYNGYAYFKVKKIEYATHWMPIENQNEHLEITLNKMYRLYLDQYSNELVIVDDRGNLSTLYLCHNGLQVIMEGSQKWWNYVERLYFKEWQQTDEYKTMIKESMEVVRKAERE